LDHPDNITRKDTDAGGPPLRPGLYVVATPIGNLGDITARARDILCRADLVLAEDRRMASRLLQHIGASPPVENYSDHNAARVRPGILERLANGAAIALTSDAGTPLISDPGYKLVDEAREQGSMVHAVPGPSALTAALSVSGLPTDRFLFLGFPPPKSSARKRFVDDVKAVRATLVLYESPRRLRASLKDLASVLGARPAAVARELTKLYEEVRRGTLDELTAYYEEAGDPKGEIVIIVGWKEPAEDEAADSGGVDQRLRDLMAEIPLRDAVDLVADESGLKRRDIYRRALDLKDGVEQT
jgi:16S rRNA (cytidine1402-2'-O)-methyltransferase